jgi:hypothetical protein
MNRSYAIDFLLFHSRVYMIDRQMKRQLQNTDTRQVRDRQRRIQRQRLCERNKQRKKENKKKRRDKTITIQLEMRNDK